MQNIFSKDILSNKIRMLIITDTHGYLPTDIDKIRDLQYDACFLLGDIYQSDLDRLRSLLDLDKTYGIIGNHNYLNFLRDNGIRDIHGQVITVKDITFAGWGGSIKYKAPIELGFDGEFNGISSIEFAKTLPKVDVLLSHDSPLLDNKALSHSGIKGISWYLEQNHVSLNIHGHLHQNRIDKISDDITSIGVFRIAMIDEKGNVELID